MYVWILLKCARNLPLSLMYKKLRLLRCIVIIVIRRNVAESCPAIAYHYNTIKTRRNKDGYTSNDNPEKEPG